MDKNFLRSFSYSDELNVDKLVQNLQNIKISMQAAQSGVEDPAKSTTVANSVDESVNAVIMLKRTLRQFELLVANFQHKADKTIPQFKNYVDNLIHDYRTAYDATENFNKDWFSNQMYSENGKIEIAAKLLNAVLLYCNDNTETLTMIANGDIDILSYIRLPRGYSK